MIIKTKTCTGCGKELPATEEYFWKRSDNHGDGFRNPCIKCRTITDKKRRETKSNKIQCTKCKNFYPATTEYFHRQSQNKSGLRSWCKKCRKRYSRFKDILRKYGITVNDYNRMFQEQHGRCAICGTHQKDLERKLYIDHNHDTGKVRGLLCNSCNSILGYAKDNTLVLLKSIKYLRDE